MRVLRSIGWAIKCVHYVKGIHHPNSGTTVMWLACRLTVLRLLRTGPSIIHGRKELLAFLVFLENLFVAQRARAVAVSEQESNTVMLQFKD